MTVIDRIGYLEKIFNEKKERQVKVLFGVDREKFVEYLLEAMARLP